MLWALAALLAMSLATLIVAVTVLRALPRRRHNSSHSLERGDAGLGEESPSSQGDLLIDRAGKCLRKPNGDEPEGTTWFDRAPADVRAVIIKGVGTALDESRVKRSTVVIGDKTCAVTITPAAVSAAQAAARVQLAQADED